MTNDPDPNRCAKPGVDLVAECESLRGEVRAAALREAVQTSVADDGWQEVERQRVYIAVLERDAVTVRAARHRIADALDLDPEASWEDVVSHVQKLDEAASEAEVFRGRLAELLDAGEAPPLAELTARTNAAVTERDMLRAAVAGRSMPTEDEIRAHDTRGGLWRCVVLEDRALTVDMMRGRTVPFHAAQLDALDARGMWWALTATGQPFVGPLVPEPADVVREKGEASR